MSKPINIKILTTEKTLFEGQVDRISSFNEVGAFYVYPMHANFISILGKELTLYYKKEKVKQLQFEQAVMKVKKDIVYIFLGIEVLLIDDQELNSQSTLPAKK
mgnify:CR=1 FL=1